MKKWFENKKKPNEYHLKVYSDRSVLLNDKGGSVTFIEGPVSKTALENQNAVAKALDNNFLDNLILEETPSANSELWKKMPQNVKNIIDSLVSSVTSEIGRALVGLTVMQMCVKSIAKSQSIRLHKGSRSTKGFSWRDGVSMRTLDKRFITPTLRKHNLLKLNADGFMMTRSLAENYPYTKVYKAAIRGAKRDWVQIVDWLESGEIDPLLSLKYLISKMIEKRDRLEDLEERTLNALKEFSSRGQKDEKVIKIIREHIEKSQYGARLLEIAIHSLFQVLEDEGLLDGKLSPLSQMRSANKKHDNVGDVEVVASDSKHAIFEAWDSKYKKYYLYDELCELEDKLDNHSETKIVGFVTDAKPEMAKEIIQKIQEMEDEHEVQINILEFENFVKFKTKNEKIKNLGLKWMKAYVESLAQRRRVRAPIDEPCGIWLRKIQEFIKTAS